jgi:hypothetical protein
MKKFLDSCHGVGVRNSAAIPIIINGQFSADGANRSFFAFGALFELYFGTRL